MKTPQIQAEPTGVELPQTKALPASSPTFAPDLDIAEHVPNWAESISIQRRSSSKSLLRTAVKWLALTSVAAAVLWPIADRGANYQFKSIPQYLHQEWVWWVVATK